MDDRTLIARVLAGHTEEFAILVERHQRMIQALAQRWLHDADAAGEVTQATFVRAFTGLDGFRGEASVRTWLCGIALNECRTYLRARPARRTVPLDEVAESSLPAIDPPATAGWLARFVTRLPDRQRTVVALRVGADLSFGEIARLLGITENAAKVNFHHAIVRLRQWLAEP